MRILALFLLTPLVPASAQCPVHWEAPDGVLPDQAVPAWTRLDNSSTPPALGPASLTIQTSSPSENQLYFQMGTNELVLPPVLIIEAAVWYVSGASTHPAREAAAIDFDLAVGLGNTLYIGPDEIFLNDVDVGGSCNQKGNAVPVTTTDGFHEYRIEVDTTTGSINVFFDGLPSGLTGSVYSASSSCFVGPRIFFGESSSSAFGVSEWAYVRHNAGAVGSVASYCTAGTSASGCQASLSVNGTASASAGSGFDLIAGGVEGNKDGLFFFGANGRQAAPWGNGTSYQCVVPPVKRGGLLAGSGNNGSCDGAYTQDLNALWQTAPAKNPGAGAVVQAQLWHRDPVNTSNQTTSLSNALEFSVCP